MSGFLIILLAGIDETQRTLIHAQVKKNAEEWWHEMPDVWIVASDESPQAWRERLKVFVPNAPGFLLVFMLPAEGGRKWATSGLKSKWKWVLDEYATPNGRLPANKPAELEQKEARF
ncbi:hypothetical protein ACIPVK_16285 [Paeniglutamicibacter sp. MACA_103]|uniref:hypothetical protein n=1 Tax=Paeniglutamicibacter sp. MACA_103 TaxID=3377337 RepID=UPI003893EDA6